MRDIAKKLNVSTVTVSKALSDKDGVSDSLRARIKQQAEKMRYVYNSMPQSMLKGRNFNIGILIGTKYLGESSFYWIFFQKLLSVLKQRKYLGILEIVTAQDEAHLVPPVFMETNKVDGVILLGQLTDPYIGKIVAENPLCVFLDFYSTIGKCDSIATNNFFASYKLTKLLIDKGHKKIGFIGTTCATTSILDRYLGFCKAMLEAGLPQDAPIADRDEQGYAYQNISLKIGNYTAYVCNNDQLAGTVIRQFRRQGIYVPEDISIVGFDNADSEITDGVDVTSVAINIDAMCEAAATALLRRIEDDDYKPQGVMFIDAQVIEKQSALGHSSKFF
jgi:LacI family transcriptional regulator